LIGQVWHAGRATLVLGGASVARLRASCEETNQPEGAPGAGGLRSLRLGNRRRTARQKDGGELHVPDGLDGLEELRVLQGDQHDWDLDKRAGM